MAKSSTKFTFKIILSYLVLGAILLLVGFFIYAEFKNYTAAINEESSEKKIIETGTLINLVFETDGLSRLALLSENDIDFAQYQNKTDSLFKKIEEIKLLTTNNFQLTQLDTVKKLLKEKTNNIEQLRVLRLTNKKDTSLDDILREVKKLETSVSIVSVESLVENPAKLTKKERQIFQSYADYLNRDLVRDTATVKSKTVDSMLVASRYIVAEAKKQNSRIRESLDEKENELIRNDLTISDRLREIIAGFDREIAKTDNLEKEQRSKSVKRTSSILKLAAILGALVVLLFSYIILSDFFKAERFKRGLEDSKNYAESLVKSREQLIATVSHDLKTPLNTISGYSELFENSSLTEKQKYYLSQINSSSHFISHLVDDLMDYSKLEAGRLKIESLPFSLENILFEAANAAKQQFIQKPVLLKLDISNSLKNKIYESDPLRIRQIINNLVGNAFKFTESGTVQIDANEIDTKNGISNVQISVIDTGIGISKEKQKLIFNEFTQAENDTSTKFGGSGLGLAISKKLTELLNGKLTVKSVPEEGSTFTFTIPLQISKKVISANTVDKNQSFDTLNAVIIDDDKAMCSLLKEMMEQMNISVKTFSEFSAFSTEKIDYDFILTDIQMQQVDGFKILENLKNREVSSYKNQPVIAMTGSREHHRSFYLNVGFAEMLAKPFTKLQIITVLKHLFPNQIISQSQKEESTNNSIAATESDAEFNLTTLKSFLDTQEALEEVLDVFNTQTERDLIGIKTSIKNNDFKTIKDICHRMLTMMRQLNGSETVNILEKMEKYSENENTSEMQNDFKNLCNSIEAGQKKWLQKVNFDAIKI